MPRTRLKLNAITPGYSEAYYLGTMTSVYVVGLTQHDMVDKIRIHRHANFELHDLAAGKCKPGHSCVMDGRQDRGYRHAHSV